MVMLHQLYLYQRVQQVRTLCLLQLTFLTLVTRQLKDLLASSYVMYLIFLYDWFLKLLFIKYSLIAAENGTP